MDAVNLIYPKKGKLIDSLNNDPLSKDFLEKLKSAKKISNIRNPINSQMSSL